MTDALQTMLGLGGAAPGVLSPTSRYSGVGTTTMVSADGQTIVYLRRRIIPGPERLALLQEHVVTEGDRLDNIAGHYLGDPELFWRICDANGAMRPGELTATIGRRLRITLPEGFSGAIDG